MCPLRATSALLLLAAGSAAQIGLGDDGRPTGYFNPESPQVKPIAVGRLASGVELVFACNTPDNAVCVFTAADMQPLQRVPVGQEPVTRPPDQHDRRARQCGGDEEDADQGGDAHGGCPFSGMPVWTDFSGEPTAAILEVHPSPVKRRRGSERFDSWFAQAGTVAMVPGVGRPYFFYNRDDWGRHPH